MSAGECLVCGEALSGGWRVTCAKCQTPHHRDCFQYNGRCAVYACGSARFLDGAGRGVGLVKAEPAAQAGPAVPIPYDYTSGAERVCRAGILVGLLIAGAAPLTGLDPARYTQDPWFAIGGVVAALAALATLFLQDVLVVDPASRTIRLRRTVLGLACSWPLYRFDEVKSLRLEHEPHRFGTLHETCGEFTRAWLAVELGSGAAIRLGDVHGTPGWDPRPDLLRLGRRIASAMNVRFDKPGAAVEDADVSYHVPHMLAKAAWFLALVLAMRWGLLLLQGHLGAHDPLPYLLALAAGLIAAHWWFLARPLGTMGQRRKVAIDRLMEAYKSKKTHRSSETPAPLVAFLVSLFGFFLVVGAVHAFFEDLRAHLHFRPASARIETSRVVEFRENKATKYRVDLGYRYAAGGAEHHGTRRAPGTWATSSAAAAHLRDHYGEKLTVYYDPVHPGSSRVSIDLPWVSALLVLAAASIFELGLRFYTRLLAIALAREE